MAVHHEASGDVVQDLADVLAEAPHRLAAVRASTLRLVNHVLARQVIRPRFALRLLLWTRRISRSRIIRSGRCTSLCSCLFEILNTELELIETLTLRSEPVSPKDGQLVLELLDLERLIDDQTL